jgi:hypothetical protein
VAAFVFASITVWYMLGENFIDRREKRREEKRREEEKRDVFFDDIFLHIYNMTKYTLNKIILILQDLRK